MSEIIIEKIDLSSDDKNKVSLFLSNYGLVLEKDVENTIVAKLNEEIIGTCSNSKNTLKCFAVNEEYRGEGITSKLITYLTNILFDKGIYETFIFTKPNNVCAFKSLGYKDVFTGDTVALLEGGMSNIQKYVAKMFKSSGLGGGKKAALVMNCNPFTLGHRYIIEKASKENLEVVVFIVEENASLFSFEERIHLVKKGCKDLENVHIIGGGKYIISSNTFPSYFMKSEDEKLFGYTMLDANIFGKYIAPIFNIDTRYIGTEPSCTLTNKYNEALLEILPKYNIQVKLINRRQIGDKVISASEVRRLMAKDDFNSLKEILPETTYNYIRGKKLILEAREVRFHRITQLLEQYNMPVLCAKINYPGIDKNNDKALIAFNSMKKAVLKAYEGCIHRLEELEGSDGKSILLVLKTDGLSAKKVATQIEEGHCQGRLFDIDIYIDGGRSISREDIGYKPRKCLVCEEPARVCTRLGSHDMKEVQSRINDIIVDCGEDNGNEVL